MSDLYEIPRVSNHEGESNNCRDTQRLAVMSARNLVVAVSCSPMRNCRGARHQQLPQYKPLVAARVSSRGIIFIFFERNTFTFWNHTKIAQMQQPRNKKKTKRG